MTDGSDENRRFKDVFEAAPGGIAIISLDGVWLEVNPALCELLGYSAAELVGAGVDGFAAPGQPGGSELAAPLLAGARTASAEHAFLRSDGEVVSLRVSCSLVRGAGGEPRHMIGQFYDVTESEAERRRQQAELERLATHDPLTGLANRRTFEGRLALELARIKREGGAVSLAILDVDNFKRVNDTLGHPAGDAVLARVAEALAGEVRGDELLARVGGEEFAWIIRGADEVGAEVAVERGRSAVASTHFGEVGRVTISGGISSLVPGMDAAALYRAADQALLAAKRSGRNRVVVAGHNGDGDASGSLVA